MKKKILLTVSTVICVFLLTACGCSHEWANATCEMPKTCSLCGETEGEAGGHIWQEAGCTVPRTCTACAATEGEATGHSWEEATCQAPRTCSVCAATEGEAAGHILSDWRVDGDTMIRACSVCGVSESVPADHEAILKAMLTGRWNCTQVNYGGSMLPGYYVYPESIPYFEIKEDGSFHVYTVSTEYDGILRFKEYVAEEEGNGYYLFFCEVDGNPRMAFVLVPTPDDDPYLDEEEPYIIISGAGNSLYFKAETEGCEQARETLIGNWVSVEEYVNGETVAATGYSLTFGNDQSFTLNTDTRLTGTWSFNGAGGSGIAFYGLADNRFESFGAGLHVSSEGVRCSINLGNNRHIQFVPATGE